MSDVELNNGAVQKELPQNSAEPPQRAPATQREVPRYYFYLDWRPFASTAIMNFIIKADEFTNDAQFSSFCSRAGCHKEKLKRCVSSFGYELRTDGLFIFYFILDETSMNEKGINRRKEWARDFFSHYIKQYLNHIHKLKHTAIDSDQEKMRNKFLLTMPVEVVDLFHKDLANEWADRNETLWTPDILGRIELAVGDLVKIRDAKDRVRHILRNNILLGTLPWREIAPVSRPGARLAVLKLRQNFSIIFDIVFSFINVRKESIHIEFTPLIITIYSLMFLSLPWATHVSRVSTAEEIGLVLVSVLVKEAIANAPWVLPLASRWAYRYFIHKELPTNWKKVSPFLQIILAAYVVFAAFDLTIGVQGNTWHFFFTDITGYLTQYTPLPLPESWSEVVAVYSDPLSYDFVWAWIVALVGYIYILVVELYMKRYYCLKLFEKSIEFLLHGNICSSAIERVYMHKSFGDNAYRQGVVGTGHFHQAIEIIRHHHWQERLKRKNRLFWFMGTALVAAGVLILPVIVRGMSG